MPSGRGMPSPSAAAETAANSGSSSAKHMRRKDFKAVGLIYTRSLDPNHCSARKYSLRPGAYVAQPGTPGVEDFDSRAAGADVTYCPNSDIARAEAPLTRFASAAVVRIVWHSACSLFRQAARPRPHRTRTRRAEENSSTNKQASDQ